MQEKNTNCNDFKEKLNNIKLINEKTIPYQTNSYDCGVFICKYAEYISTDKPFDFTQKDMIHFRKKIQLSILFEKIIE